MDDQDDEPTQPGNVPRYSCKVAWSSQHGVTQCGKPAEYFILRESDGLPVKLTICAHHAVQYQDHEKVTPIGKAFD